MPSFQTVAEQCNSIFNTVNIAAARAHIDKFRSRMTVGEIAVEMGIATREQGAYLGTLPAGMGAALKALIVTNLERDRPFGMQFLWFEGAEWEFLISEVSPTDRADSRGGISLMLRSPKL